MSIDEQIESYRERAADFVHAWAARLPASRFLDVDGTPENALLSVTPSEARNLVAAAMAAVAARP